MRSSIVSLIAATTLATASSSCLKLALNNTLLGLSTCTSQPGVVDGARLQISPDGTKVVFQSKMNLTGTTDLMATGSWNIWIMSLSGGTATALTTNTASFLDSTAPRFDPTGTQIVFHSRMALSGSANGTPTKSTNIWVMNIDGTGKTALTQNQNAGLDSVDPSVRPDGVNVVFASKNDITGVFDGTATLSQNIWEVPIGGGALVPLTSNTIAELDSYEPAYSPDSTTVAFSSYTDLAGTFDTVPTRSRNIWVTPSGAGALTSRTQNTNPRLDSYRPVFDAASANLTFASRTDTTGVFDGTAALSTNIYAVNAVGGIVMVTLTSNTAALLDSGGPSYDPTGATVVFHSSTALSGAANGTPTYSTNIWTVPSGGGALTALTTNSNPWLSSLYPVYDPTGATIVFESQTALAGGFDGTSSNSFNLWSMTSAGASLTALTSNSQSCVAY